MRMRVSFGTGAARAPIIRHVNVRVVRVRRARRTYDRTAYGTVRPTDIRPDGYIIMTKTSYSRD